MWEVKVGAATQFAVSENKAFIAIASRAGAVARLDGATGEELRRWLETVDIGAGDGCDCEPQEGVTGLEVANNGTIVVEKHQVINNSGDTAGQLEVFGINDAQPRLVPLTQFEAECEGVLLWWLSPKGDVLAVCGSDTEARPVLRVRSIADLVVRDEFTIGTHDEQISDLLVTAGGSVCAATGELTIALCMDSRSRIWELPRGSRGRIINMQQLQIDTEHDTVFAFAGRQCWSFPIGGEPRSIEVPTALAKRPSPLRVDLERGVAQWTCRNTLIEVGLNNGEPQQQSALR